MSQQTKPIASLAGAVAGFLLMAAIGWHLAGNSPQASTGTSQGSDTDITTKTSPRQPRDHGRYHTPNHAKSRMQAVRAASTPEEKLRATLELANTLPVSEIEAWLEGRWFDDCKGYDLSLFNKILNERWRQEDPEGFAIWSIKNGHNNPTALFGSWAESDPQRAIAFFEEHPNQPMELQLLKSIATTNPAIAIARLQEVIDGGLTPSSNSSGYYANQVLLALAKSDPAALDAMLDSLPPQWQASAEGNLIAQKLENSFSEELHSLYDRADGWKVFQQALRGMENGRAKLLDELDTLPESWKTSLASEHYRYIDNSTAEKWLSLDLEASGFSADQAKQIRLSAIQQAAYNNPQLAIKQMNDMELSNSAKKSMISNIISRTRGDSEKAGSLIALLGSEEDKQIARDALEKSTQNTSQPKITQPSEWLEKAISFDSDSGSKYQFLSQIRNWDQEKITALTHQFKNMPDEKKQNIAQLLASGSSNINPIISGEAIQYLAANPSPEQEGQPRSSPDPIRLASNHAVQWAKKDPIAASAWVQTLPSGEAKNWAQKNLAATWAQYDPEAAEQWTNSLPSNKRSEVQAFMKSGGKKP